jgi:hypothetical protein
MTNWLSEEEGAQLRFAFEAEMARLKPAQAAFSNCKLKLAPGRPASSAMIANIRSTCLLRTNS